MVLALLGCLPTFFLLCSASPLDGSKPALATLKERTQDSSTPLVGDYSFLSFKPQTQANLWAAVSKVPYDTLTSIFAADSEWLDDALSQNSATAVGQALDDLLTNKYTSTFSNASAVAGPDNATNLGIPPDPVYIAREDRWAGRFWGHRTAEPYASTSNLLQSTITMLTGLLASMDAADKKPADPHPGNFVWTGIPERSGRMVTFSFQAQTQLTYEDLFELIKTFGEWIHRWTNPQTPQVSPVPGCYIDFYLKHPSGTQVVIVGPAMLTIRNTLLRTTAADIHGTSQDQPQGSQSSTPATS